jgi:putative sigma-54 modulation protein
MQTSITFKNFEPSEPLKTYVKEKLDRFDKFLYNPAEANVILTVEKFRHIAEINISGDKLKINGKEETNDMYSAIDMVLDKLETQIKKTKQKSRAYRSVAKSRSREIPAEDDGFSEEERETRIVIKNIEYKPMDIEEAIMQMELVNDNFIVFADSRTEQVNVLYRRKDGHLGLIQPNN